MSCEESQPLLRVEDLTVAFPVGERWVPVVRGVSLAVEAREFVGLVGESGSGKSVTAFAIMRLVPSPGRILSGRVLLGGQDLSKLTERQMCNVRGARIGMVFQEPATALNPVFTVGFQLIEAIRVHSELSHRAAREKAERLLELVAIADPGQRLRDYPHQLSGGQLQRVMIAIALASDPDLLIADEPTTALDVTIQAQVLELLARLREELGLAVLLITHDLAVVAETCTRAVVMYAGQVAEEASVARLFDHPAHPYTSSLLRSLPRLTGSPNRRQELPTIPGQVPDPADLPSGCPFHPRCPEVMPVCPEEEPALYPVAPGQTARCFLHRPGDGGG